METPPTPTPPKKRRKGAPHETLHVYNTRETLEDGTVVEHPNREFWVWQRQSHNARRRGPGGGRDFKGGKKPRHQSKTPRAPKGDRSNYKPRRETTRTEDSPFAALKGLYDKD